MPDQGEKTVKWEAPSTGWTAIPNQLIADVELSRNARLTFAALAMYAWQDESVWPGQERVAGMLGAKPRALRNWIDELADAEILTIRRRGAMKSNCYLLHPKKRYDRHGDADHDRHVDATHDRHGGADHDRHGGAAEEDEVGSKTKKKKTKKSGEVSPDVQRLCKLQLDLATQRTDGSKKLKVTEDWLTEMDRLIRLDGRTVEQIEFVIRWVDQDSFWASNVLSVPKLREKFDQLVARIKEEKRHGGRGRRGSVGTSPENLRQMAAQLREQGK